MGNTSTLYCECESPMMDVAHDAGCRRCGRPVSFAPHVTEVDGPTATCSGCGAAMILAASEWVVLEPGERGYTCPDCGATTVLYSAAWLDNREVR